MLALMLILSFLLFVYQKTKNLLFVFTNGIFLCMLFHERTIFDFITSIFNLEYNFILEQTFFKFLLIILLTFILLEIYKSLGMNVYNNKYLNTKYKNIFMLFYSFFEQINDDFYFKKDESNLIYQNNRFIISTLSILSLNFLILLFLFIKLMPVSNAFFIMFFTNFFAITLLIKNLIDKPNYQLTNNYQIIDDSDEKYDYTYFPRFRKLFIINIIIIGIMIIVLRNGLNGLLFGLIVVNLINLIISAKFFHEKKYMQELMLYKNIINGINRFFQFLLILIASIILFIVIQDNYINLLEISNVDLPIYFTIVIIFTIIVNCISKNLLLTIIFTCPFLIPIINLLTQSQEIYYISFYLNTIYGLQYVNMINKNYVLRIVLFLMIISINFVFLITKEYYLTYLYIFIIIIIDLIYHKLIKGNNETIRFTWKK